MTNETKTLPAIEAPSMVPLENQTEFLPAELLVQTPEETGAEDKPVTEPVA